RLHDGSVWVTSSPAMKLGQLNTQVGELDGGLLAEHTGIDVLQDGADVILLDPVASTLAVVDPALVALSGEVRLPPGAVVAMAAGTVVVVDPEGDGWVRQIA